ncbi:MAG: glutamate ligase domain-containing protein, partial [Phycisphaerales bacterium JB047]
GARTALLRPDIAIITSIGRAHIAAMGSVERIAEEKAQLITLAPSEAVGVIPGEIDALDAALADDGDRVLRVPQGLELLASDQQGNRFSIEGEVFTVPIPGAHNAHNAALCVLAGRVLGYDDETIRTGLARATPPAMRFERVEIETAGDPIVVINDAYNANPDSMRAALATFVNFDAPARRVVVLGEMLEMGDSGPAEHQSLAEHACGLGLDRVVLLGPGFASVRLDGERAEIIPDSGDASIASLAASIQPGDTVLIKGSRGVRLERLIDKLSDRHANGRSETKNETRSHA